MGLKFVNNSEGTLAAGISASALALELNAGEGLLFPVIVLGSGDYFYVTAVDIGGNREVIKVLEHQTATDFFQTIERKADAIANGTATAYAFLANDKVQARLPAVAILAPDGTTSDTFQIDTDGTGITLKHDTQTLLIRNLADSAYADLFCKALTLSGALAIGGNALSGVTTLAMAGALSGVTTLAMGGAITGATDITASGTVQAEHLHSTDDAVIDDDLLVTGALTATGDANIPIDNLASDKKIKARDHGAAATPEVINVVYGTGSAPAIGTVPEGTVYFKYI